jgi:hypothetical protein
LVNAARHLELTGPSGGGGGLGKLGWRSEAGLDSEEDLKRKLVFKFHLNLDFGKSWRKFTRRFRRNLDMGIFLKFF